MPNVLRTAELVEASALYGTISRQAKINVPMQSLDNKYGLIQGQFLSCDVDNGMRHEKYP